MSREEDLQKPVAESPQRPWYYRDVPISAIAAFVAVFAITVLAIEFRPVRTAPPVTVVAHGDAPMPWKSTLPDRLPAIPEPPAIPPSPPSVAIHAILSQPVAAPEPPASSTADSTKPKALGMRYSVLKQLPGGGLAPVDPLQDLARDDQAVIRFEPNDAGLLSIFERSAGDWRKIASEQVQPSVAYTFPPDRTLGPEADGREFLVVFSRQFRSPEPMEADPLSAAGREDSGQPDFVVRATLENPEWLSFRVTLKYALR